MLYVDQIGSNFGIDGLFEALDVSTPTPTTRAIKTSMPPGFKFEPSQSVHLVVAGPEGKISRPMSISG